MARIYCAGPLFNKSERSEMAEIARVLEEAGHTTFLPHRDGLEFARLMPELRMQGLDANSADRVLLRSIFALDVYQLLKACDGVVANINGRVPDEGTVVEVALAWHAGKPLVLYKADSRSLLNGSDNPMLTGLSNFESFDEIASLPNAIAEQLGKSNGARILEALRTGEQIARARAESSDLVNLASVLAKHFESK